MTEEVVCSESGNLQSKLQSRGYKLEKSNKKNHLQHNALPWVENKKYFYCTHVNRENLWNKLNIYVLVDGFNSEEETWADSIGEIFKNWKYELENYPISKTTLKDENEENENAFNDFLKDHLDDPKYKNKFVAFVNGRFQDTGDTESALVNKMYEQFGDVYMYVGKITDQVETFLIDTPEFN